MDLPLRQRMSARPPLVGAGGAGRTKRSPVESREAACARIQKSRVCPGQVIGQHGSWQWAKTRPFGAWINHAQSGQVLPAGLIAA